MAKLYHPDKNPDKNTDKNRPKKGGSRGARIKSIASSVRQGVSALTNRVNYPPDMFVRIGEGNTVLKDTSLRTTYDSELKKTLLDNFPPLEGLTVGGKLEVGDTLNNDENEVLTVTPDCRLTTVRGVYEEGYWGPTLVGYAEIWSSKSNDVTEGSERNKGRCYLTLKKRRGEVNLQLVQSGKVLWSAGGRVGTEGGEAALRVEGGRPVLIWRRYRGIYLGGGEVQVVRRVWCGGGCWRVRWREWGVGKKAKRWGGRLRKLWEREVGGRGGREGWGEWWGKKIDEFIDETYRRTEEIQEVLFG